MIVFPPIWFISAAKSDATEALNYSRHMALREVYGRLNKIGTFSNGESVYQRVS